MVVAERGLVVEDAASGYCGAVVGFEKSYDGLFVRLEDRRGATRIFAMRPKAFLIDGKPVTLERPKAAQPAAAARTASGSRAAPQSRARVARASRLFVEGVHDATLVERVWGDDLRAEGVVVESLDGLDNLDDALAEQRALPMERDDRREEQSFIRNVNGEHLLGAMQPRSERSPASQDFCLT